MVVGQIFAQLEAGEFVTGRDSSYDPRSLEIGEVAVGRTARNVGNCAGDVGDAQGPSARGE
jgi:hypothetical protein